MNRILLLFLANTNQYLPLHSVADQDFTRIVFHKFFVFFFVYCLDNNGNIKSGSYYYNKLRTQNNSAINILSYKAKLSIELFLNYDENIPVILISISDYHTLTKTHTKIKLVVHLLADTVSKLCTKLSLKIYLIINNQSYNS